MRLHRFGSRITFRLAIWQCNVSVRLNERAYL